MKKIGIIGGMGPAATVDFLNKIIALTPANRDQDHIPLIIEMAPQIPDRTNYLLGRGADPLPYLQECCQKLETSGAEAICMP
ncbi:MAG: aspartate/glutamate racemase family protein, partial [Kordiimonadaceae bacterium]|nr:aspartate/glutamate racemase family protein [Kordiimonadaceae bacterium]